jgi:dTDP-4-amino-4,6-dideoxygalactose transaminase
MNIPFIDVAAQNKALKNEILPLWAEILESGAFIGGEHVEGFEKEFAAACGVKHCALVNSGTDALRFNFLALGLKQGDEVVTVPNTFIATTEALSQAGGKIIFADIDPATYTLDPAKIEATITPKTRGIVPVHLYGQPAEMDAIMAIARKRNLWVVEDACQAHLAEYKGKTVGSLGHAAAFSFYPGKNLGACGEGGAVTTDDPSIAAKVRMLRDHGQSQKYHHDMEGYNGRCDALQAATLRVKLRHLPAWTAARINNALLYSSLLKNVAGIALPFVAPDRSHVFHLFVIETDDRDSLRESLLDKGIATGLHYPLPLHLQKAYEWMHIKQGAYPVTEKCAKRILSLPMYPELTEEQIVYICTVIKNFMQQRTK